MAVAAVCPAAHKQAPPDPFKPDTEVEALGRALIPIPTKVAIRIQETP